MTRPWVIWLLLDLFLLLTAGLRAAPHCAGSHCKRQNILLTETLVEVLSETQTTTFTVAYTSASAIVSAVHATTTSEPATAAPNIHLAGDIADPNTTGQGVLFLPLQSDALSIDPALPGISMSIGDVPGPSAPTDTAPAAPTSAPNADVSASVPASTPDPSASVPLSPTATLSDSTQSDTDSPDGSNNGTFPSSSVGYGFAAATPVVKGPLVSAYYPDWVSDTLPPEAIDFTRLDWVDFAFALPDQNFNLQFDDPSVPGILKRLVTAAHAKNAKVKLSIGGWTGSKYFSSACATASNRQTFVNNIVAIYKQYNIDGIDFDWEYPGHQGEGSNIVSPNDSANFLSMLQLLRRSLPKTARLSAAVADEPFIGPNGQPLSDVSAFAGVLDWVNIMNYDVFDSSSNPGPNAPLDNACQDSSQPSANAVAALNAWSNAKFPINRLMLGVPAYGYLSASRSTSLQHRKRQLTNKDTLDTSTEAGDEANANADTQQIAVGGNSTQVASSAAPSSGIGMQPPRNTTTSPATPDISQAGFSTPNTDTETNAPLSFSSFSSSSTASTPGTITLKSAWDSTSQGSIQLAQLLAQGALVPARIGRTDPSSSSSSPTPVTFVAVGGFTRFWDACSSTPFLVSPFSGQVVAYDDMQSLGLKAGLVRQRGALGTAMWDLSGDTDAWDLTNALRAGLGKQV